MPMKTAKSLLLTLIIAAPLLTVSAAPKETTGAGNAPDDTARMSSEPGKKFVYKQSGGVPQELEIYFPAGWDAAKHKVPGVILFHGGAWVDGDLDQFRYACQHLAGRGLVAATANYRMIPREDRAALPEGESYKRVCITDAKSAIRWMKQHAAELGIDPQRLITGGGSAGGHIAVLATTTPELNDPNDPPGFDTGVAAYLLFNPAFQPDDHTDAAIDVFQHLTADLPPAIFFFGDGDLKFKPGGDAVFERFKALGRTGSEFWIAKGQKHGFFNRPPWQNMTMGQADRFLVKQGLLTGSGTPAPPRNGEKLVQVP